MSKIKGINVDYPIIRGRGGYFSQTFTTISARRSNILVLLKTEQGERVMNPNFGIGIRRFLFENITEELIIHLENKIRTQIDIYIPDINIDKLDIRTDYDELLIKNKIEIELIFSLKTDPSTTDSINEIF